mgnify:CR=1 FL=1
MSRGLGDVYKRQVVSEGFALPHSIFEIWLGFTSSAFAIDSWVIPSDFRRSLIFSPIALKSRSFIEILPLI